MTTLSCWSHYSASRSRYSISYFTLVFLTTFTLFFFYIKSYSKEGKNELKIIRIPSVEDHQYNLLGFESFNDLELEQYRCDSRHLQGKYKNGKTLIQIKLFDARRRVFQCSLTKGIQPCLPYLFTFLLI